MRQSLIFGGLESIAYNANRKQPNLRFFEFGNCYFFNPDKQNDDQPMAAYREECFLGLWVTGKRVEGSWIHPDEDSSFYELKAYVENIMARVGLPAGAVQRREADSDVFAAATEMVTRAGQPLIVMGVVSQALLKAAGIERPVYYAEINWTQLMKQVRKAKVKFTELSKFPAVSRDLALLLDENVTFEQVAEVARQSEKKLLRSVALFDVYEGDKLPKGKNSYAVNFILQDEQRTLADKQIDAIMQKIIANVKKQLGAELR